MADMIVRLYDLPEFSHLLKELQKEDIYVKRAIGPEKLFLEEWCRKNFTEHAAGEISVAMARMPVSVFVAIKNKKPIGYACYEATAKGFFGPTAVLKEYRGKGIGKALLCVTLRAMFDEGYGYAIIGGIGPKEFYEKNCGAIEIPDSTPGMYVNMIRSID